MPPAVERLTATSLGRALAGAPRRRAWRICVFRTVYPRALRAQQGEGAGPHGRQYNCAGGPGPRINLDREQHRSLGHFWRYRGLPWGPRVVLLLLSLSITTAIVNSFGLAVRLPMGCL